MILLLLDNLFFFFFVKIQKELSMIMYNKILFLTINQCEIN